MNVFTMKTLATCVGDGQRDEVHTPGHLHARIDHFDHITRVHASTQTACLHACLVMS